MATIAILGTGMAAYGAVSRLQSEGIDAVVFDKNHHPGGHTASFRRGAGFVFDEGPHVSFTTNERVRQMLAENVGGEFQTIDARVNNHWRGHWIKHPAQCNLHGLPVELVVSILEDFIAARDKKLQHAANYADWLVASFGRTFAETFPMQYGLKYHTTTADNMSTTWLGPRPSRPELGEALRGALTPDTPEFHYVDQFRYPSRGGFVSYLEPFFRRAELRLGREVVRVDPHAKCLHFRDGGVEPFDALVSSIPLPKLVPMIDGTPNDVLDAAQQLACSTCVVVNIGLAREDVSPAHWSYFYDEDFFFTRLSFPHMLSPGNVPPGHGSIQAEVYYSNKYRPLDRPPEQCIEPVIADLKRCGLLREDEKILMAEARLIPYANVIFDHDRESALPVVSGYLDSLGIATCGRYGEWGYHWTDESFVSGENAAQRVLDMHRDR